MQFRVIIKHHDKEINRILSWNGILVEAENEAEAGKKVYERLFVEVLKKDKSS